MTDQSIPSEPDVVVIERKVPRSAHVAVWLAGVAFVVGLAFMAWSASGR